MWLEKIDTAQSAGVFMQHEDGSLEQVAFGESESDGHGRETDLIRAEIPHVYEPDQFKLPGFVTLGIKIAIREATKISGIDVFAKLTIAPGCSTPVFPMPILVDEDGVIDPITNCDNGDQTIHQRRACFLRLENSIGELIQMVVVIEAPKLAMQPTISEVAQVTLMEAVRMMRKIHTNKYDPL